MTCEEAFEGLCQAYWRLLSAIDKKVKEETDGLPDWMVADVAREVRETCYLEEKKLWEDAYARVMSAMARADIAAGFEPFTPLSKRVAPPMEQQVLMEPTEHCKSCGTEIWWSVTAKGKPMPMSKATGLTHFADCPHAKSWSKSKKVPA
jgi:hypothetical protein